MEPAKTPPKDTRKAAKPLTVTRTAFLADYGQMMEFHVPTTVRFHVNVAAGRSVERTFQPGEKATCTERTFGDWGGPSYYTHVCSRVLDAYTVAQRRAAATGLPWIDQNLDMPRTRGWAKGNISTRDWRPEPRPGAGGGEFRISCFASHMGFDDPIVKPGWPGAFWHHHTFFGSNGITGASTDPLDYQRSTCAGGDINRTSYWVPSMIDTRYGKPIVPAAMAVYYKGKPDVVPPKGLRFIAGNPMNGAPRDPNVVPVSLFTCYRPDGTNYGWGHGDEIPGDCPKGGMVIWTVFFPNCWNGRDLDSADHKSHMAVRGSTWPPETRAPNGCPLTHPVQLFDLSYQIHFPLGESDDVSRWRLASDSYDWSKPAGYSAHGDWWNGWDQDVLTLIKQGCHDAEADCSQDNLPDGRRLNQ
jgi:hypothetical protein